MLFLCGFRTFCAIFRTTLRAVCYTSGIKRTANDVITNTRKVFNTTTTNKHDAVFLKVVTFSWDVSINFL